MDRHRIGVLPAKVVVVIKISRGRSPRYPLEICQEGMTQLGCPIASQLPAATLDQQLIGPAEKLIVDKPAGVGVAKELALPPRAIQMNRVPHQIVFAEQKRMEDAAAAADPDAQSQRNFVHRRDAEGDSAVAIRIRDHVRVGDEWLDAQNTLRLSAPDFGASVAQLEGQIAPYNRF